MIDWTVVGAVSLLLLVGGLAIYLGAGRNIGGVARQLERIASAMEAHNTMQAQQDRLAAKKLEVFRTFDIKIDFVKSVDSAEGFREYNELCEELRRDTRRFMSVVGGVWAAGIFTCSLRITISAGLLREDLAVSVWSIIAEAIAKHGFRSQSYTEVEKK